MRLTSDNLLDKIFRQRLGNFRKEPAAGTWERIEAKIETASIASPERAERVEGAKYKIAGMISTAAVLGFVASFLIFNQEVVKDWLQPKLAMPAQEYVYHQSLNEETLKPVTSEEFKANASIVNERPERTSQVLKQISQISKLLVPKDLKVLPAASVEEFEPVEVLVEQVSLADLRIQGYPMSSLNPQTPIFSKPDKREGHSSERHFFEQSFPDVAGAHLGPVMRFNNTWIFNQNTHGEFGKSELAYRPDFGYEYGLHVGLDFNESLGIQMEWISNSVQGQQYEDNLYSGHTTREVDLVYTKFPLMLKYKKARLSPRTQNLIVRNYVLGMQYAQLQSANITTNEVSEESLQRFDRNEVSAILGLEYDIFLGKHLFFSIGGRASVGGSDINSLRNRIWNEGYRKSHNILLGLHSGLNYKI